MIGTIGCVPGLIVRPRSVKPARKYFVFSSSLSRNSVEALSNSSAFKLAATMCGATLFEIGHVGVLVTDALRVAEADAIDDAGVIEFVTDHRVLIGEQRFEQTAVSVEARRVKNGVLGAEKLCQRGFEFLMDVLGAANE